MFIAMLGPVTCLVNVEQYIPKDLKALVTADLPGICQQVRKWADTNNIPRLIIGRDFVPPEPGNPFVFLRAVVSEADRVVLLDDGRSPEVKAARAYAATYQKSVDTINVEGKTIG